MATYSANSSGGIIDNVLSSGTATLVGNDTALTAGITGVAQAAPAFSSVSGYQAASFGVGLPTDVSTITSGHPVVAEAFGGGNATVFGAVGLAVASLPDTVDGDQTFTSDVTFDVDTSGFAASDPLEVGFVAGAGTSDSGFENIVLTITEDGSPNTYTFNDLADAESFFDDNVLSLGALPVEPDLSLDFNLAFTTSGGNDAFDGELIFGDPIPEPSSTGLLAGGAILLLLGHSRNRAAKGRRPASKQPSNVPGRHPQHGRAV
jgi:hypothetical protein